MKNPSLPMGMLFVIAGSVIYKAAGQTNELLSWIGLSIMVFGAMLALYFHQIGDWIWDRLNDWLSE
jgi:disulfide bond formation protein DsbB